MVLQKVLQLSFRFMIFCGIKRRVYMTLF